jgi:ABC-type uncharacterized transport system ATPase subunit
MSSVVQIEGLIKRYDGREVVRGIDLNVPAGRCFGVLGPNGAGKTTTLRLLLGQSPVNGGEIHVFGLSIPQSGRAVFNIAWEEYSARRHLEALAHRVAWTAVKKRYRKFGQAWVKK